MSPLALRPEPPQLAWRAFDALSPRDLHDLLRLRADVFVVEQACVFAEIDGRDPDALHLLARMPGCDGLAATLRLFPPKRGARASIGRVATAASARGLGLGRAMMVEGVAEARRRFGGTPVEIGAQARLEAFYAAWASSAPRPTTTRMASCTARWCERDQTERTTIER